MLMCIFYILSIISNKNISVCSLRIVHIINMTKSKKDSSFNLLCIDMLGLCANPSTSGLLSQDIQCRGA